MSGIILGQARLSNHTLTTPGATFGVPPQEDFTIRGTSQSWGTGDLALSEIGVNEGDGTAFIRIGGTISQIGLVSVTSSTYPTLTTATISTTNATATTIVQPVIITYSQYGWIVTADVIGRYGYTASYDAKIWAAFKVNSSGLVVQVDTTDKIEKTELSTATSDITTNGYQISLKVTGETGKNIDWKAFYTINIM